MSRTLWLLDTILDTGLISPRHRVLPWDTLFHAYERVGPAASAT